jgi:alcohol dehydrogenase
MKAAQLIQYGGKEAIAINDISVPEIVEGKVLIEVYAAGVNPADWKVQNGLWKDFAPLNLPVTLGGDLAGVVVKVGSGVTEFKEGDEVYGSANVLGGSSGSFAEFALTKSENLALKPNSLNFQQAGALPLVGTSAVQALIEHINLQKDQKILIHGGAGGIGSIAIQIAKYLGALVATTVSTDDVAFAKDLGADEVIDYKSQRFEKVVSDVDAVFDTVGGETAKRSVSVLKNGGTLVSMNGPLDEKIIKEKNITALVQQSRVTTERLTRLSEFVDQRVITVNIEKTFPLVQTADALEFLKNTPPKGKVVIALK